MKERAFSCAKLSPLQVAAIVHGCADADKITPPSVDDLAGVAEAGRRATGKIAERLHSAEVKVAQGRNRQGQVHGDLELDGHGLRSFHASPRNAKFHKYCSNELLKSKHAYFLTYIRVLGLRKRGSGCAFVRMLPSVCLPPKSKPPTRTAAYPPRIGSGGRPHGVRCTCTFYCILCTVYCIRTTGRQSPSAILFRV